MLFSLCLGPTNPWMTAIAMETLDIQRAGFSPALRYSSQHSHFYMLQQRLTGHLHSFLPTAKLVIYRTLLYHSFSSEELNKSATSESTFSPVNFKCKISWLVSFYAFFKGWLPLSQPPSCLRNFTSFATKIEFRVLIWRSGLFSFRAQELRSLTLTAVMYRMVFGV